MPSNWDATTNLKLLFHFIEVSGAKASWDAVAAAMNAGFTGEACRQHYAKLKKSIAEDAGNGSINEGGPAVLPSPRKRKPRTPKAPNDTPTKRQRKTTKKAQANVTIKPEEPNDSDATVDAEA